MGQAGVMGQSCGAGQKLCRVGPKAWLVCLTQQLLLQGPTPKKAALTLPDRLWGGLAVPATQSRKSSPRNPGKKLDEGCKNSGALGRELCLLNQCSLLKDLGSH